MNVYFNSINQKYRPYSAGLKILLLIIWTNLSFAQNLLPDPSFENNNGSWSITGFASDYSPELPNGGNKSGWTGDGGSLFDAIGGVSSGETYSLTYDAFRREDGNGWASVNLAAYDAEWNTLFSNNNLITSSAYNSFTNTITIPPGAAYLGVWAGAGDGGDLRIDRLSLTAGHNTNKSQNFANLNSCNTTEFDKLKLPKESAKHLSKNISSNTITGDQNYCGSGNPTLISGPEATTACSGTLTYLWQERQGESGLWTNIPASNNISYDPPLIESTYQYKRLARRGSCDWEESNTVTITIHPNINANAGQDASICSGSSIILTASGGTNYDWSNNLNGSSILVSPITTTTYTVTVSDINGCQDTDQVTINIYNNPPAQISGDLLICEGSITTLTATGGNHYAWNNLSTSPSIFVDSGTYSVTVIDNNGCTSIASETVVNKGCSEIGNRIWNDLNGNGIQELGEPGIEDVKVDLLNATGNPILDLNGIPISTLSNPNGNYAFSELFTGSYRIEFDPSSAAEGSSLTFVSPNMADEAIDSDAILQISGKGQTDVFTLSVGQNASNVDAGLKISVVPIALLDFYGRFNENSNANELTWKTASEINNDKFIIERLIENEENFTAIGEIQGNKNSSSEITYNFDDVAIHESGTYLYQLRQIDFNGAEEIIGPIGLRVERSSETKVDVYPNPAQDAINISMSTSQESKMKVVMYNVSGKVISPNLASQNLSSGKTVINVSLDDIPNGSYILRVTIGNQSFIKKLSILK